MIKITSYENPDMDGCAAMFALKELLNKCGGGEAEYYLFNEPQLEVFIVCKKFGIKLEGAKSINKTDKIVLVDCNDLSEVHNNIKLENVVEVIDHHAVTEQSKLMKNAKIQIDNLGAMATIIVERFIEAGVIPSRESAIMLFHAIASNTLNLSNINSQPRDVKAYNYLKSLYPKVLNTKSVKDVFIKKSEIDNIEKAIISDLKILKTDAITIYIGQLEIARAKKFVKQHAQALKEVILKIQAEYKTQECVINICDNLKHNGFLIFANENEITKRYVEKFKPNIMQNGIFKTKIFVLRKRITRMFL